MEFRKMEYFLMAAETLNFSEAAKQLYISPQALTQQIMQLETEIGGRLFDRSTRKVKMTELGLFCYRQMKPIKVQYDEAAEKIRKKIAESKKIFRIGFFNALPKKDILNPLLDLIQIRIPNYELELTSFDMSMLWKQLDENTLDFVVNIVDDFFRFTDYDTKCLLSEPAKIVVSEKHVWASRKRITYADIADADMLQFREGDYKEKKNNFYSRVKCRNIFRTSDFDSMLALLESGKYFAVFPRIFNLADYLKLEYLDMPEEYAFTFHAVCGVKKAAENPIVCEIMECVRKKWK